VLFVSENRSNAHRENPYSLKAVNVESDIAGYLGVLIDCHTDGTIIMRRSGLAQCIIKALHS
jgi:hypothetical protein